MKYFTMLIAVALLLAAVPISHGEEQKLYRSATELDYPPFSVTGNGEADGFSVELLKAVADEMGLVIDFKIDQWEVIKNELKDGTLDVLPLVGHTAERDKYFDFTVPYMVMHGNIFVRSDNDAIHSEADLFGKEVAVMAGDNSHEYAIEHHLTDRLVTVKTYTEAFEALSDGQYDAVLAQSIVGHKLMADLNIRNIKAVERIENDGHRHTTLNLDGFEQKFCFAVKEGDKELLEMLNEGLAIVSANGRYQEIYQKWFPFLIDNGVPTKTIIAVIAGSLVVMCILFLFISLLIIRREVKRKTDALENANRELLVQTRKAEEASAAKGQFLANMSHEIRTPLNGLVGMLQLMEMTALMEEQKEYVRIAMTSSEALLTVINDILDYSKIEAGKMELENIAFDFRESLRDVISLFRPSAQKRNLALLTDIDPAIPDILEGDPFRFKQVISNLIGNAVKYTAEGWIELKAEREPGSEEGAVALRIVVRDTGVGIPEDQMENLFRSFSQGDSSNTRNYGGTGLGLAISRSLAQRMSGDIMVESQLGTGSSFTFTCVLSSVEERDLKKKSGSAILSTDGGVKPLKILLAEDNDAGRMVITRMAEKWGWVVEQAHNGMEAVEKVKRTRYDIILMDVRMPLMDGIAACAAIKTLPLGKRTPVIAITANALAGDREKYLAAGMDDYLPKPVHANDLHTVVKRWASRFNEA